MEYRAVFCEESVSHGKFKYIDKWKSKAGNWVYKYKDAAEDKFIDAKIGYEDTRDTVRRFRNDPKWESNYAVYNAANAVRDRTKNAKSSVVKKINSGASFVSEKARHNMIVRDNELLTAHYVLTGGTYFNRARGARMERLKARYGKGYKNYGFYDTYHGKKVDYKW